jgi:tRNA A-37 threonylcarbamoyl transferase component Bud32
MHTPPLDDGLSGATAPEQRWTAPENQPTGLSEDTATFTPQLNEGARPAPAGDALLASTVSHRSNAGLGAIGACELLDEISRGGMGVVYRARQRKLDRLVALKVILDGSFSTVDQVKRFHTEAQAAANLDHANIAAIYEFGEHDGRPYLVMEYVDGEPLSSWHESHRSYDELAIVQLLQSIASAVEHAHQQGVIHRDLKPSNVLIDRRGVPHVVDFGLAKLAGQDSALTAAGDVLGTPSYMAPEQAMGKSSQIGPGVDVYGLGAILYELLTGRPPFRAETLGATLAQVETQPPVPPRFLNASVSRDLEAICLKCLEKDPANRYSAARELSEDLGRKVQGARVLARRRIGVVALTGKLLLLAALVGGAGGCLVGAIVGKSIVETGLMALAGALLATLAGTASICFWNELALPAWLFSRTAHPLAKTVFGLGLVLASFFFYYPLTLFWDVPVIPVESAETARSIVEACLTVARGAVLIGIVGKLFCLAAAYRAPAQGPLMWSIAADLMVLAFGVRSTDDVGVGASLRIAPAMTFVGAVLFVLAMKQIAAGLEEPYLGQRAQRLLVWMGIVCPALLLGGFLASFVGTGIDVGFGGVFILAWLVGLVRFARLIGSLQERALLRI